LWAGIFLASLFSLAGCNRVGEDDEGAITFGRGLYSCEPREFGYDRASLAEFLDTLPICTQADLDSMARGMVSPGPSDEENANVRMVLINSACDEVRIDNSFHADLAEPSVSRLYLFNGYNTVDGRPLRSGEYFLNIEIRYDAGEKDTIYQGVGFLSTPLCK